MPAVSVIILASNNGRLLTSAAGSILHQTMGDLELIVADNASTDGSIEHLLHSHPDARMRIIRHESPTGIAASYAAVIPLCTSPWIAIMDADDESHPMRLEMQLKAVAVDAALDLIVTGAETIDAEGNPLGPFPSCYSHDDISGGAPFGMPVVHPTLMGKTEVFQRVGYRPIVEVAPDYDFVTRALEAGARFGAVSLPLLRYRRHAGSSSVARPSVIDPAACALRLCTARRRAGRPERVEEAMADVRTQCAATTPLAGKFLFFAGQCRREGFVLLAALHAALAVRVNASPRNVFTFLRYLGSAVRRDQGSTTEALAGCVKGPFWVLLRRAGLAGFPRY